VCHTLDLELSAWCRLFGAADRSGVKCHQIAVGIESGERARALVDNDLGDAGVPRLLRHVGYDDTHAGAREVHMRVAAPPTTHPCFYGIDTPERDKLLASRYDVAGMAKVIGVDSLAFLSIDGLYRAMGLPGR